MRILSCPMSFLAYLRNQLNRQAAFRSSVACRTQRSASLIRQAWRCAGPWRPVRPRRRFIFAVNSCCHDASGATGNLGNSDIAKKIISRIKGGLGNQLFCYAVARRLALVNNAELVIDDVTGFARDHRYHRQCLLGVCRTFLVAK